MNGSGDVDCFSVTMDVTSDRQNKYSSLSRMLKQFGMVLAKLPPLLSLLSQVYCA